MGKNNSEIREDKNQMYSEIKNVYDKISAAFGIKDLETVLSYFSDSSEMAKVSSGIIIRGKKELSDYFHKRIGQLEGLSIRIENIQLNIIDETHLWTVADEFVTYSGKTHKAVVSNIFIKTKEGWKILLDHTTYLESNGN
jgi:ketosteroid isomerase-like protein